MVVMVKCMFRKALICLLSAIFCTIQAGTGLASYLDNCSSDSIPPVASVSSVHAHNCCCRETEPCRCEGEQETAPSKPDMALNATSCVSFDQTSRDAAPYAGMPLFLPIQNHKPLRISDGTGPRFASFYLTNLTFRC